MATSADHDPHDAKLHSDAHSKKKKLNDNFDETKKDIDKLWAAVPAEEQKEVEEHISGCQAEGSRWVFRRTPNIKKDYDIKKVLGNPGQYGVVKEAVEKSSGKKKAVKIVFKWKYKKPKVTQSFFQDLRTEVRLMKSACDHPNIIKVDRVFEDISNLYVVMEHCSGGELFDRISSDGVGAPDFNEGKASAVMRQIVSAVYYLHSLGISHCDLKPENFIFVNKKRDSKLKLIDFGMAKIVHWRMYHRRMNGTPYYIAPEVLNGHYNESCDMWSIGVIMFIIVFGFPPFHDSTNNPNRYKSDQIIYERVKKGFTPKVKAGYGPWFPADQPVSMACKDLIARLLRSDVAGRMTSEEAMSHPWLLGKKVGGRLKAPVDADVNRAMKFFHRNCQLQSEILLVLKNCKYLSSHQEAAVKKTFQTIDLNGDGLISEDELFQALHAIDSSLTRQDAKSIMLTVDANSNGVLEYDELLSSRINRKLISKEERMRKVFRCLDVDGSGTLTAQEIQGALMSIHEGIDIKQCQKLIAEADKNNDNVIDYEEWIEVFRTEDGMFGALAAAGEDEAKTGLESLGL